MKAFITGINGQDGAFLAKHLLDLGYTVYGGVRSKSKEDFYNLEYLKIKDHVQYINFDLLEHSNISKALVSIKPDEIYNLAAQSFVGASFKQPLLTTNINSLGVLRILDVIYTNNLSTKLYQASTSEMFGKVSETPQNENVKFHPRSPYGVSKLFSHWIVANYRESYDIFACSGILFNHESELRGKQFVTRKITDAVARIYKGANYVLELGNIYSKRDWGYAKEYVKGMHLMLQQDTPDDYVLATGVTTTIKDFVTMAFNVVDINIRWEGKGLDEKGYNNKTNQLLVKINPDFYRPAEVDLLLGDAQKAKKILNWKPNTNIKKLAEIMVYADLERI